MGPPPYTRSSTQPYQAPLDQMDQSQENICLVPSPQNTFEVHINRNSLGLGFSISGGVDLSNPWIRIKKIFPLQPACETGQLEEGDVILKVSGVPLSNLSLRQALDILRTSPPSTILLVCRLPDPCVENSRSSPPFTKVRSNIGRSYSYGPFNNVTSWECHRAASSQDARNRTLGDFSSVPPGLSSTGDSMEIEISPATPEKEWSPTQDESRGDEGGMENTMDLLKPIQQALNNNNNRKVSNRVVGEFSIQLTKVNGSLGFSLQSTEDSVLNHIIKGIVREPALSDGRLKPGDKLVSANGVDLSSFSHQELIMFLRQCPETVTLGLYRDASRSQTPLDPESPTASFRGLSPCRKGLRYEAKELVRSLNASRTSLEKAGLGSGSHSSGTLGRRRRPFSPATRPGQSPVLVRRHGQSPAATDRANLSCQVSIEPTVESPLTPHSHNASAPSSLQLTQALNGLDLSDRLHIEEMDSCPSISSPVCQEYGSPSFPTSGHSFKQRNPGYLAPEAVAGDQHHLHISSIPNSPILQSSFSRSLPRNSTSSPFSQDGFPVPRPRDLNLGGDRTKRQGYIFSPSSLDNSTNF